MLILINDVFRVYGTTPLNLWTYRKMNASFKKNSQAEDLANHVYLERETVFEPATST